MATKLIKYACVPARRGRLARAHAVVKRHPGYNEHDFYAAVEAAFTHSEVLQNAGSQGPFSGAEGAPIIGPPAQASTAAIR